MIRTSSGYAGGQKPDPTYRLMGDHSETVQVVFDPQQVSYAQLLDVFWESHNPLYNSSGRQYRNAIFYLSEAQRQLAEETRRRVAVRQGAEVKTDIEPAGKFYAAEDYHQKYLLHRADPILQQLQAFYPQVVQLTASTAATRLNGYLGCNGQPEDLQRELELLGLSSQQQAWLVEYLARSCSEFEGMVCPAPVRQVEED